MKTKKIYISVIVLTFVATFILMKTFDNRSYASSDNQEIGTINEGTEFKFIRKNIYSKYHISNTSFRNDVFGTKLIAQKSDTSKQEVVYCAEEGKKLSSSSTRKRYGISSSNISLSASKKEKLSTVMPYMYPYITLSDLKNNLKDASIGIADDYTTYGFDSLNVQETISAVQASIWNIIDGKTSYNQDGYDKILSGKLESSGFKNCESFHTGKMLTSEEEKWYAESGCNSSGNFYKYVYGTNNDSNVKNRIKVLTSWYTTNLYNKLVASNKNRQGDTYEVTNHQFNADGSLDVTIKTNVSGYSIVFLDTNGKELLRDDNVVANSNGNQFTITNLPTSTKEVKAVVKSKEPQKNVYFYIGSGQDFIGVDNSYYTQTLSIDKNDNGRIVIYKVTGNTKNVEVDYLKCFDGNGELISNSATCSKAGIDSSICGEKGCLDGAKFILYSSVINSSGKEEKVIKREIKMTNENGVNGVNGTYNINDLSAGTYYLKEIQPPIGYDIYDYGKDNVDASGYIKIDINENQTASVIVNNDKTPEVCFSKVDASDTTKILDGANLFIEDIDQSVFIDFVTSSQEKEYCLSEGYFQVGTYYIYEEEAPTNYIKSNNLYKFVVGKHEKILVEDSDSDVKNSIELKVINGKVTIPNQKGITKTDLSTGACVEGAHLVVKDKNGTVVDEWTSVCQKDSQGNIIGNDPHQIPSTPGEYTLTETITPSGYATAETIEFTIDADGNVNKSLDMKDDPIEVCLRKVSDDKKELSGAEFELYDESGKLLQKLTTPGNNCVKYLPIGKYTVKETKAPDGYKLNEEPTIIEVKDTSETQIFEIINEVDVPRTSLDASKVITMIASVFIIFGIGAVCYYAYQKQH